MTTKDKPMQEAPPKPVQIQTWRCGNLALTREVEELDFGPGTIYATAGDVILTAAGKVQIQYRVYLREAKSIGDAFERFAELYNTNNAIDRPIAVEKIEREVEEAQAKAVQQDIARKPRG